MILKRINSLSLPGDSAKANEDAFGGDEHAAVVMDGATMLGPGLMPGPSDAAWIAQFGARRLIAHLKDEAPGKALRLALADTEKSFGALRRHAPEAQWQVPCASMMLVKLGDGQPPPRVRSMQEEVVPVAGRALAPVASEGWRGLEFMWFGDCGALLEQDGKVSVIGETLSRRAAEADRARAIAAEKQLSPASGLNRPEFLSHLRAARDRMNSGKYWLFTPDRRAATHAARQIVPVQPGARLLLATDGFLALASDYKVFDAAGLMQAAREQGLNALGAQLREIEESDALGETFARFKKSDDATALLLEIE